MGNNPRVKRTYLILLLSMAVCLGCQWHLRPASDAEDDRRVSIVRYDRIEHLYLTTADFAALQQMKTVYPMQTRMLIENVLKLGRVDESDINSRFLLFFQDSTLQAMMGDVERQYANTDDLDAQLTESFRRLSELLPCIEFPSVYTQIGSLDQSIIVGQGLLGISLDKYLGSNHPLYLRFGYTEEQRAMMTRQYIVPDCLGFFLMSLFPLPEGEEEDHVARIQYVVNQVMGRKVFDRNEVAHVENYMRQHPETSVESLLSMR